MVVPPLSSFQPTCTCMSFYPCFLLQRLTGETGIFVRSMIDGGPAQLVSNRQYCSCNVCNVHV